MFDIDAVMRRKDSEIESDPCMVAKVIEIPTNDFFYFKNHLLEDYSFLMDNIDLMGFDDDNIRRCVLVLGEGYDEGILVDTQGCNYARYTAHVPNGRQLAEINQYQSLNDFAKRMRDVTEEVVRKVLDNHQDGYYYVKDSDIPISTTDPMFSYSLLGEMLSEREEFESVETFNNEIGVALNPKYFLSTLGNGKGIVLSEDDVDIMLAKHMLHLRDAGGEQADFTNCVVRNMNLSRAVLNSSILTEAVFVDCDFTDAELCFADATGASFIRCKMPFMVCEEADFSYSKFTNCDMKKVMATHSCFVGTEFSHCNVEGASFQKCCIDRSEWSGTELASANTRDISTSYEEWNSDNELKPINLE